MLSFDDARSRWLDGIRRIATEVVVLSDAAGRVLAQDLLAREGLPSFDHSAMDGYALALSDLEGDPPWRLPVTGESSAGSTAPALTPGSACRIFTGAEIPRGADAVVAQENAVRAGDTIELNQRPRPGQNIRRAGEDIARGALALPEGTRLAPGALALAGMLDEGKVLVAARPRVTILCTGSELRLPGTPPRPATIPESNSAPLAALARNAGGVVRVAPIASDDVDAIERAIEAALEGVDLLVTVGGVSVGDHDVVRPALERAGVALDFWRVAIKPGKPLVVGRRATTRVLGLPGNPASAMVTFTLFGMPLLRALQGDARSLPTPWRARLSSGRKRTPGRVEFVRARLQADPQGLVAVPDDNQSSGAATSLAHSDGLAVVPAGEGAIEQGAWVDFLRWDDA
jgi:molybdopterin molybdotransferase